MKKGLLLTGLFLTTISLAAQENFIIRTETRFWDSSSTSGGYTLFSSGGSSYLVDFEGHLIHSWNIGNNPRFTDAGTLLDAVGGEPGDRNSWAELDWEGNVVWQYSESRTGYHAHDDFARIYNPKLGDSTFLYIASKDLTAQQCLSAGCDPAYDYDSAQADAVVEVDRSGNVIWEWCFFDHVVQDLDPGKITYGSITGNPGKIDLNLPGYPVQYDWLHCNSIDYNQSLDLVVINSVHGEFYVIDHGNTFIAGDPAGSIALAAGNTGNFRYRFGDPAKYDQGNPPSMLDNWEKSTAGHKQLGGSYDIQWIRPGLSGEGNFLVFNSARNLFELTPQSYIMEINPFLNSSGVNTGTFVNPPSAGYKVVNSPDGNLMKEKKNISKQVVWRFSSKNNTSFYSTGGSAVQRLPDGHALVCSMNDGHIFEIDPADTSVVWEYVNPVFSDGVRKLKTDNYPMGNSVFSATRYQASHPALAGHDLTPGATLTGLPPEYLAPVNLVVQSTRNTGNVTLANGQYGCYDATKTITVAGNGTTFVVQEGGTAVMIAGMNILLEPGTVVNSGGTLQGYITTTGDYCLYQSSSMETSSPVADAKPTAGFSGTFRIYPNPASGWFILETSGIDPAESILVRIYSIYGQMVYSALVTGSARYSFPLEGTPAGLCFVMITAGTDNTVLKLLKIN